MKNGAVTKLPIFVVDAFTSQAFAGNPAAVVLGDGDAEWMQSVAAEMNLSETAFLRERADGTFDLRWFTPTVEVDLCGHATLASAHVLWETAQHANVTFHTRSGALLASHNADGTLTLDFPITEPQPETANQALFDALGIEPIEFLRSDPEWFLCVVEDAGIVRGLQPDFDKLRAVPDVKGVYVSARGDDGYDIVSRCFGPGVGIDEDPVTGSMHCVLIAYWAERLGKEELRAFQASPRGGEVTVVRKGERALLMGRATTILRGELLA
jgi:PhzF family phenazine biosynthesis protein